MRGSVGCEADCEVCFEVRSEGRPGDCTDDWPDDGSGSVQRHSWADSFKGINTYIVTRRPRKAFVGIFSRFIYCEDAQLFGSCPRESSHLSWPGLAVRRTACFARMWRASGISSVMAGLSLPKDGVLRAHVAGIGHLICHGRA
jgi:hypothetical protein